MAQNAAKPSAKPTSLRWAGERSGVDSADIGGRMTENRGRKRRQARRESRLKSHRGINHRGTKSQRIRTGRISLCVSVPLWFNSSRLDNLGESRLSPRNPRQATMTHNKADLLQGTL